MTVHDINVRSEIVRPQPSPKVWAWLTARPQVAVYTTATTQAELLPGIELLPNGKRRDRLEQAMDRLLSHTFAGRILPFDDNAARLFAPIVA